jgi:hypothetical protein
MQINKRKTQKYKPKLSQKSATDKTKFFSNNISSRKSRKRTALIDKQQTTQKAIRT